VPVAAGTAEDADEELELRVPLGIVAFLSLPAMMLWVLAGVLIAAGQVLNVAVLGAVATSVLVIRFGRTGATVDLDGIEVRTVAATRRFRWPDVEGFSVLRVARGQLLVNVVGGESLAIAGLPSRDYRRRHYRSGTLLGSTLLDDVVADLRRRLQIGRRTGDGN
jgi:Bacterial PH domain